MSTTAPSKKQQDRWLLPDAAGWTVGPSGTGNREPVADPVAVRADGMVWPLKSLIGLPLWLAGHDAATFTGAAALQLEKQGVGPRMYHEESLRVSEVVRDADRTLVMAAAVSRQVRDDDFCVSARHYTTPLESLEWPSDRMVLFREREQWAVVVTRGRTPVYFSVFSGGDLPVQAATDLACMVEGLARGGYVAALSGVTLWDRVPADTEEALRQVLGLPVVLSARPPWTPSMAAGALIHPAVARQRVRQDRSRQLQRLVSVLGLVLFLVLAVAGGRVLWAMRELKTLESEYAALRTEADAIREVARRWSVLEGSVDLSYYPLEHLRTVASLLPANGVRLTEFQWKDGQLRLTGEASDTTMAFSYAEGLKSHNQFVWEMDPPNIQPNNSAQFVVKGRGAR